jgi:hypothetical protein
MKLKKAPPPRKPIQIAALTPPFPRDVKTEKAKSRPAVKKGKK